MNFNDRDPPAFQLERPISKYLPNIQPLKNGDTVTKHSQFGRWSRREWWTQGGATIGGMDVFAYSQMMAAQELAAASLLSAGESISSVASKVLVPKHIKRLETGTQSWLRFSAQGAK